MTKKELMSIVDNQLPKGEKCLRVRYPRFSSNELEGGAHRMGIFTENHDYIMAWFKLDEVDLRTNYITLRIDDRTAQYVLDLSKK